MMQTFKKGMALLMGVILCVCLVSATLMTANAAEVENAADFNTIVTTNPNGDSTYTKTFTTTKGWTVKNSAIQTGGATVINPQFPVIGTNNTTKAVCMNGKTSAPGSVTSPTLTGGISKLTMRYTKMFTDTKLGVKITVTDLATNTEYTKTVARDVDKNNDKYVVWTYDWDLDTDITGDFKIEVVNTCPSNANSNKDRFTLLELSWEAPVACQHANTSVQGAVAAYCTTPGHTGKTVCTDCGETISDGTAIDPLGHKEVVDAPKDADCTQIGLTEGKHCERCGETLIAQIVTDPLGHQEVVDTGKKATCTVDGLSDGKHCQRCNKVLVAQEKITAPGHLDKDKDGKCDTCGEKCGQPVPPTGDHVILTAVVVLLMSAVAIVITVKRRMA